MISSTVHAWTAGGRRALLAALLGCSVAGSVRAADQLLDPPQGLFEDSWMSILLQGQQTGYAHLQTSRAGDEIHMRNETVMRLSRVGSTLEIRMVETSVETVDGRPLSFDSEQMLASQPIRKRGTIADGKVRVVMEQFGQEQQTVVDYPQGALMPWAVQLEYGRHPVAPGLELDVLVYMPAHALNIGIPTKTRIGQRVELDLMGARVPAYEAKTTMTFNGLDIDAASWVDERWQPLKMVLNLMGMDFEMVRCDQAAALKDVTPPEMFVSTLIPLGKKLDRDALRGVTFLLGVGPDGKLPHIPETEMQKIVLRRDKELKLYVRRLDPDTLEDSMRRPGAELDPFLKPTLFITSDDPLVKAMAAEAVGSETNPYRKADLLRQHVSRTVKYRDLGTAFATASEICRRKEGDCTENGVLLAALARAVGIPSRLVTGLIYVENMGGRADVMGFHMWTQLWIGGSWVDMDAAWDQTTCDATHIAIGTHSTEDHSMSSLISGAMLQAGALKISVVATDEP